MGKEGELWDDSALINAFDHAMSKYKIMHGKGHHDGSTGGVEVKNIMGENACDLADESDEAKKTMEADDKSNVASNSTAEIEKTNNISSIKENYCVVPSAPKPHVDSSVVLPVQDAPKVGSYSNSQGVEDYTLLLNQYYEVEEQRQKILQQLHQLGNWNSHFSAEGSSYVQWGTGSSSQECQLLTSQASHPTMVCSCCPYVSQCVVTPCTLPACSLGEACVGKTCIDATAATGPEKRVAVEDGDIVKTAMGAAEKAISSMRMKISEKEDEKNEGEVTHSACSETDLTVVLNAWYSAGFYTGKYLMEQSIARKHQG
ncbi:hypothetical protein PVL29_002298 [Vitis rotundifolia]|uniref:Survival Motor Neuron Gemin2-binding domain-containing protein n=1 Tax=Vitis rotundifolia TaxID=103349 RepID=A0AA39E7T6_VITRO|nr:hypothetical protein PVL29_002298 [Vitis rotundifolia]